MALTGTYENVTLNKRICPICKSGVETDTHVLTQCPVYEALRTVLYDNAIHINKDFIHLSDEQKCVFVFSNLDLTKRTAKTCYNILQLRFVILYKAQTST